jgi:hypothetical protein
MRKAPNAPIGEINVLRCNNRLAHAGLFQFQHWRTEMRPYHPNNLGLQPYAHWRVIVLARAGKFLGIQFKIAGIPFGGEFKEAGCASPAVPGSGNVFRVDREGNCMKPERRVVLRGRAGNVA